MKRSDIFAWYKTESLLTRLAAYLRSWILPMEAILEVIPQRDAILDVACGHGLMIHALSRTQKKATRIHGLDLDKKRLEVAQRSLTEFANVKIFYADALKWDPPIQYDCVILSDILHHLSFKQKGELIRKVKNFLTPKGLLVVKDVDWYPRWKGWVSVIHDRIISGIYASVEPRANIEKLLKTAGLRVVESKRIDRFQPYAHYLIIAAIEGLGKNFE